MEFKDFLNIGTVDESAQLKLELISKINTLIGTAEISALRRVAKLLEGPADKIVDEENLEDDSEVDESESEEQYKLKRDRLRASLHQVIDQMDRKIKSGGKILKNDPLLIKKNAIWKQISFLQPYKPHE